MPDSDEMDTWVDGTSARHTTILHALLASHDAPCPVERPLPSHSSCGGFSPLSFDRAGPLVRSSQRWTCSWARLFTQRLWTFGYAEEALASIFDALPAGFCGTIQTASDRLADLMKGARARIADAAELPAGALLPAAGWEEDGAGCEPEGLLECLEDIWERDGGVGFIEFAFDPATQVPLRRRPPCGFGLGRLGHFSLAALI